jgi:beta-galactosidase
VVDDQGNVVPDATNLISFKVSGNGTLSGVDNGDQRDDDSFKLDHRKAFKGHAYAVIQADRKPGDITIIVQSDRLKPASATIQTHKESSPIMAFEDVK